MPAPKSLHPKRGGRRTCCQQQQLSPSACFCPSIIRGERQSQSHSHHSFIMNFHIVCFLVATSHHRHHHTSTPSIISRIVDIVTSVTNFTATITTEDHHHRLRPRHSRCHRHHQQHRLSSQFTLHHLGHGAISYASLG